MGFYLNKIVSYSNCLKKKLTKSLLIMTWVEALPGIGIALACATLMNVGICLYQRGQYRGVLDRRVPYGFNNERMAPCARLKERDDRLALYPTGVQWAHSLWRPSHFLQK